MVAIHDYGGRVVAYTSRIGIGLLLAWSRGLFPLVGLKVVIQNSSGPLYSAFYSDVVRRGCQDMPSGVTQR